MTPIVHVGTASPSDAGAIADLSRRLIEHGLPWTWRPGRVARAMASADTNVAVVREHDELVGFGIMKYGDEDAHLVLFAVRAWRQRQGVGRSILAWLEACAAVAGSSCIRVEARRDNVAARSFVSSEMRPSTPHSANRVISRALLTVQTKICFLAEWSSATRFSDTRLRLAMTA